MIDEPLSCAHRDKDAAAKELGAYVIKWLEDTQNTSLDEILNARMSKILSVGSYEE